MAKPRRFRSAVLAMVLLVPSAGSAQDHLVTAGDIQARFAATTDQRAENLRSVEAALSSPAAAEAAALLHADLGRIRAGASSLTDEELRNVAARANALTVDPVAGANPVLIVLAVIGAIVVLALLIASLCVFGGSCEQA
jgi:hypothetical protein